MFPCSAGQGFTSPRRVFSLLQTYKQLSVSYSHQRLRNGAVALALFRMLRVAEVTFTTWGILMSSPATLVGVAAVVFVPDEVPVVVLGVAVVVLLFCDSLSVFT